jgi:hypothetical protein
MTRVMRADNWCQLFALSYMIDRVRLQNGLVQSPSALLLFYTLLCSIFVDRGWRVHAALEEGA